MEQLHALLRESPIVRYLSHTPQEHVPDPNSNPNPTRPPY